MTTQIQSFASNYGKMTTKCFSTKCFKLRKITEICYCQFFQKSFPMSIIFSKSFSLLIRNQSVHHTSLTRKHFWIQSKLRPSVSYLLPIKKRIDSSVFFVLLSHLLALLTFLHREKMAFQQFITIFKR
jgi:hypothetical protein